MWKFIQFTHKQNLKERKMPFKYMESYALIERCLCRQFSILFSPVPNSIHSNSKSNSNHILRNSSASSFSLNQNRFIHFNASREKANLPVFLLKEFQNHGSNSHLSLTEGCISALDQALMQLCHVCDSAASSPLSSVFQIEKVQSSLRFLRKNSHSFPVSSDTTPPSDYFFHSSTLTSSAYPNSNSAVERIDDSDYSDRCSDSSNGSHNKRSDRTLSELNENAKPDAMSIDSESFRELSFEEKQELKLAKRRRMELKQGLIEKQRQSEMDIYSRTAAEYREMEMEIFLKGLGTSLPLGKALILHFFSPLREKIAEEQENIKKKVFFHKGHKNYANRLLELSPDVMAVITIHRTVELMLSEHAKLVLADDVQKNNYYLKSEQGFDCFVKFISLASQVGSAIETEVKITRAYNRIRKKRGVLEEKSMQECSNSSSSPSSSSPPPAAGHDAAAGYGGQIPYRIIFETKRLQGFAKGRKEAFRLATACQQLSSWDEGQVVQVGARLVDLLIQTATIPTTRKNGTIVLDVTNQNSQNIESNKKAFVHDRVVSTNVRKFGCICVDPYIRKIIEASINDYIPMMPYMPMIVQPQPWKAYNYGGHLALPCSVMRTNGSKQQIKTLKNTTYEEMRPVYQALDVLGETAWRINKNILSVIEEIWNRGGSIAGIVPKFDETIPEKPSNGHAEELLQWRRMKFKSTKTNSERLSLRADLHLKLKVANLFKDFDRFYYPHNLDFRGRAYPMHPHLHHLGADPSRAMLEFADGKKLGKRGLYWLKIHLANLMGGGVDKLSFDERVKYADDHIHVIFDSARSPLDGEGWWRKAEDPFQCLATCMDIMNATLSPNHEEYVSHIPVHQDGSCNGLQHYAALGRDLAGAQQVNMTFIEKPADVYSVISDRVKQIVNRDYLNEDSENFRFAKYLNGHMDRKLVKQTVMTLVYGVTFVGARDQINSRIREKGIITDESEAFRTANYAAKITLEGLDEIFCNARKIMAWLAMCAKMISSKGEAAVAWKTPLGLPVVQPYRKTGTRIVRTTLQALSLYESNTSKVFVSRQKSAFPPNFVHSLHSSHMMKTAIECNNRGLCFAGVHDSFWTHAGDIETMNEIIRREFVELHEQPILENLLRDFKDQFPKVEFPDVPLRGKFDLKQILTAPYFFN